MRRHFMSERRYSQAVRPNCELIGAFAGPGGNAKVSYPTTSEEATKVILSLLLTSPACVEFDDMDSD